MSFEICFYNTLTGKPGIFRPRLEGKVSLYTCGPTVYDYAHIGNFRTFVFEDLLKRFLEFSGFEVKHVMNITDVDDKTIAGAMREGKSLEEYTEFFRAAFEEDLSKLNILPPSDQPRATQAIEGPGGIIEFIERLLLGGFAYVRDGSVYFRVSSFPSYGKLSKKKLELNREGVRIDLDEYAKEEGADFALWKKIKSGEPGWDSPWGKGRPGWHIECSVMSMKHLGETIDIHAGGEDLIFPHHENEIAQAEALTGKPFVLFWLHAKHLLVNGEKMSKSKGNFFTLRDLLEKGCDPMAVRAALIFVHYRSPLNFTFEGLKEAADWIRRLDDCYARCLCLRQNPLQAAPSVPPTDLSAKLAGFLDRILMALGDDLNVAPVLAEVLDAVHQINSGFAAHALSPEDGRAAVRFFCDLDRLLGLDITAGGKIPDDVAGLLEKRHVIRSHPDFKKSRDLQLDSDKNREAIQAQGWLVKDGRPGEASTVKRKRRVWDF